MSDERITPTHVDGATWVGIGFFTAAVATFTSDEAAKYLQPETCFICKAASQWILAALLSLKMFRSTTYANMLQDKKTNGANGNGTTQPKETK